VKGEDFAGIITFQHFYDYVILKLEEKNTATA